MAILLPLSSEFASGKNLGTIVVRSRISVERQRPPKVAGVSSDFDNLA